MHDDIRKFSLEGELSDANIVENKQRMVNFVESVMRDDSYVPALDLEPQFTLAYNMEREAYDFTLSVYGVQVDKEEACETSGVMNGKRIPKYTPQPK